LKSHKKTILFFRFYSKRVSEIRKLSINFESAKYKYCEEQPDLIEVTLAEDLAPKDSVVITVNYKVKFPDAKIHRLWKKQW
jgi:hypothetical protein